MNPPIRSEKDREALRKGILDGTIDMIATDHAPHSEEEKAKGLAGSAMGIVGLETAFPVLYTELVKSGILPLERLVELMAEAPDADSVSRRRKRQMIGRYGILPKAIQSARKTSFQWEERRRLRGRRFTENAC